MMHKLFIGIYIIYIIIIIMFNRIKLYGNSFLCTIKIKLILDHRVFIVFLENYYFQ